MFFKNYLLVLITYIFLTGSVQFSASAQNFKIDKVKENLTSQLWTILIQQKNGDEINEKYRFSSNNKFLTSARYNRKGTWDLRMSGSRIILKLKYKRVMYHIYIEDELNFKSKVLQNIPPPEAWVKIIKS